MNWKVYTGECSGVVSAASVAPLFIQICSQTDLEWSLYLALFLQSKASSQSFNPTACSGYRQSSSCAKMSYFYKLLLLQSVYKITVIFPPFEINSLFSWGKNTHCCEALKTFQNNKGFTCTPRRGREPFRLSKHWSVLKCWHFLWEIVPGEGNRSWSLDSDQSRR